MYHTLEDWAGLSHIEDYLSYLEYLLWVFTPLAIVFILPFLIVILLYLSILFLYVYKVHKHIPPFVLLLSKFTIHRENEVSFQIKHFQQPQDFDLTAFKFLICLIYV